MTTEITVPTQTERLMAALSVAERLTSESPVAPTQVGTACNRSWGFVPGTYEPLTGVDLYFHHSPENVRQFAAQVGATVGEELRNNGKSLFTHADGVVDGVPFQAWALTTVEASAVAA